MTGCGLVCTKIGKAEIFRKLTFFLSYYLCIVSHFNKNELWLYDYVLRNIGSNYNQDKRRSRLCYFQNEVPPDSFFVYIILIFNNYNDICNGN